MQDDKSENSNDTQNCYDYFGEESVYDLDYYGNARIARGAFGEIALALYCDKVDMHPTSQTSTIRVVAVKTLIQAMVIPSSRPIWQSSDFSSYLDTDADDCEAPPRPIFTQSTEPKPKPTLRREVSREIAALRRLTPHPNIIPLLAVYPSRSPDFAASTSLCLVFDYCPIDLHLALEWRRKTFQPLLSWNVIRMIAHDMFEALRHCRSQHVLHRDIKPGNLLVSSSGYIQLCDFGLAKPIPSASSESSSEKDDAWLSPSVVSGNDPQQQQQQQQQSVGMCTLNYRPPEVLWGGPAEHESIDIYSAGVVLAEIVMSRPLFPGTNAIDQLLQVLNGLGTPTDTLWPNARHLPDYGKLSIAPKQPRPWNDLIPRCDEQHPYLSDFFDHCVALDPQMRWSAKDLLEHSWFLQRDSDHISQPQQGESHMRFQVVTELVPTEWDEPILLLDSSVASETADDTQEVEMWSKPVLDLAARRRKLLYQLLDAVRNVDPIGYTTSS